MIEKPTPDGGRVRLAMSADGRSGILEMLEGQSAVRFWEDGRDVPGPTFAWRSASAWSPKGTREPWLKFRDSRGIDVVFLDCTPGREMPR